MAIEIITAYRCTNSGCRKAPFVTLKAATNHAERCIHSLDNRGCPTCAHDCETECLIDARPAGAAMILHCVQWKDRDE